MLTIQLKWFGLVFTALLLGACSKSPLSLHTEHLDHRSLASYHIRTPDPLLKEPYEGDRIVVRWNLPEHVFSQGEPELVLRVRYGNLEEEEFRRPLKKRKGGTHFDWLNEDYREKQGLLTYRAQVRHEDVTFYLWEHQIWAERVPSVPHN